MSLVFVVAPLPALPLIRIEPEFKGTPGMRSALGGRFATKTLPVAVPLFPFPDASRTVVAVPLEP